MLGSSLLGGNVLLGLGRLSRFSGLVRGCCLGLPYSRICRRIGGRCSRVCRCSYDLGGGCGTTRVVAVRGSGP